MSDTNEFADNLRKCVQRFVGDGAQLTGFKRLSAGASQETWAFDVKTQDGSVLELILRRAPAGQAEARSSEAIGLNTEAQLIEIASKNGVIAPEVLHVCDSKDALGDGFIMRRIAGETLGRKILRDEEYTRARGTLGEACGRAAASIHNIPIASLPELPVSNGPDQVRKYAEIYRGFGEVRPIFELAIQWLEDTPPSPMENRLVHGDFRLGNFIVSKGGLAAVLDWELAHIGDPREDIGWICVNSWRFGHADKRVGGFSDLGPFLEAYNAHANTEVSAEDIDWWEMLGTFKWGVMCLIMYEAFRSGADRSVERAAIGRRASETEIDILNLMERRLHNA